MWCLSESSFFGYVGAIFEKGRHRDPYYGTQGLNLKRVDIGILVMVCRGYIE